MIFIAVCFLQLLFSSSLPGSYFVQWSANYYGNDWNRYQMNLAFLYFTHIALFGTVGPRMCVVVKEATAESLKEIFLIIEFSSCLHKIKKNCLPFNMMDINFGLWKKPVSAPVTETGHERVRDVITVLSKVVSFLCHSSASLQDGFMCHSV